MAEQTEPQIVLEAINDDQFEMRCTAHDDGEHVLGTWPLPVYEVPQSDLRAAIDAHCHEHHGAENAGGEEVSDASPAAD